MLTLIQYNVGNGSDAAVERDLLRMIDNHDPDVIGLNEIADRGTVVRKVAKRTGMVPIIDSSAPGSAAIGMLVHRRRRPAASKLRPLTPSTYVGHHVAGARDDGQAQAKYLLSIRLDGSWVVGVTHLVPSAMRQGNQLARSLHGRQTEGCTQWLETRKRRAFLMGDMNSTVKDGLLDELLQTFPGWTAPSHGNRGIDWFFTNVEGLKPKLEALDGYSSDHRPLVLCIDPREAAAQRWEPLQGPIKSVQR